MLLLSLERKHCSGNFHQRGELHLLDLHDLAGYSNSGSCPQYRKMHGHHGAAVAQHQAGSSYGSGQLQAVRRRTPCDMQWKQFPCEFYGEVCKNTEKMAGFFNEFDGRSQLHKAFFRLNMPIRSSYLQVRPIEVAPFGETPIANSVPVP